MLHGGLYPGLNLYITQNGNTEYFINKTCIDTSELFIAHSQAWNSNLEAKIMTTGVEIPQQQIKSC